MHVQNFAESGAESGAGSGTHPRKERPVTTPHEEDLTLVRRILHKDRLAFDGFFSVYFPRLCRFAVRRLSDPEACEDVVQETLLKALRHLDDYRGEASLFTWLCTICSNEVANWYRKHGPRLSKQVSLDDDADLSISLEHLSTASSTSESEDEVQLQMSIQLILDRLPDNYGKALEWKYLEGMGVEEIAIRLQTTVIGAQSLLARARTAFRSSVQEIDVGKSAALNGAST